MNNEGEILKQWVKSKGFSGQEVADILGLGSRQAVYDVYKVKVLSNKHKEALAKRGFDVNSVGKMTNSDGYQEQEIKVLKLTIEHQKQTIELLERENQMYRKLLEGNIPNPKNKENMKRRP